VGVENRVNVFFLQLDISGEVKLMFMLLCGADRQALPLSLHVVAQIPVLAFLSESHEEIKSPHPAAIEVPAVSYPMMSIIKEYLETHCTLPEASISWNIDQVMELALAAAFLGMDSLKKELCVALACKYVHGASEADLLLRFGTEKDKEQPITEEERAEARRACEDWL